MAETLLSNPVIEDFTVHVEDDAVKDRGRHLPRLARRRRRRRAPSGSPAHEAVALWHGDHDLRGVDAVVLPGGFSYGDYLRCGAISRFAPVMTEVVEAAGRGHAGARHLQRLPDPLRVPPAAGCADPQRPPQVRLPRPAAADREQPHRRGPPPTTRAPRSPSCSRTARAATSPTPPTLDRLEGEGRVVARYLDDNPNGSLRDIAGITNERGNVVGLMPHPEHAVEELTGSGTDGLGFFTSLAAASPECRLSRQLVPATAAGAVPETTAHLQTCATARGDSRAVDRSGRPSPARRGSGGAGRARRRRPVTLTRAGAVGRVERPLDAAHRLAGRAELEHRPGAGRSRPIQCRGSTWCSRRTRGRPASGRRPPGSPVVRCR